MSLTINQIYWLAQLTLIAGIFFFTGTTIEQIVLSPILQPETNGICWHPCIQIPDLAFSLLPVIFLVIVNIALVIKWRRIK